MTRPLKLCLILLGGIRPAAVVASTKKRMVEILSESSECGGATMKWINDYGSIHEGGKWFDRFAPLGEGMWINRGKEYGEFDITNWERVV